MYKLFASGLLFLIALCHVTANGAEPETAAKVVRRGTVEYLPADNESDLPPQFRLEKHAFDYVETALSETTSLVVSEVTFPSPVVTPHEKNNTVHCELFLPVGVERRPAVVVLHILGGDFELARLFCRALAGNGTAALFVKMPYYGPRRDPAVKTRMISIDPQETVRGMTQAVLDCRQAGGYLRAHPRVDPNQLGIMGISLGGITSALTATAEPRFKNVCLLLAGGDISTVAWESPKLAPLREKWVAAGGTRESLFELMKTVDPVTYASNVRGRRILMMNASRDEVIPPECTRSLWRAFGEPEIVWWNAGHISSARYLFHGLAKVVDFFKAK